MKKLYLGLSVGCLLYGCATTTTTEPSSKAVMTTASVSSQQRVASSSVGCQTPSTQCLNGNGVYIYPDGTRYEGDFKDGKRHGFGDGTLIMGGGYRYEGYWENDKPHGRGLQTRDNGEIYNGEFQRGKRHGRGEYKWPSGNRHIGEWQNGKKHGRGVHIFADGGLFMREWKENKIVRSGKRTNYETGQMVEAFFRRETGINPNNPNEFHSMMEAFLKRGGYVFNGESGKELGKIIEAMLIQEGYYVPEGS